MEIWIGTARWGGIQLFIDAFSPLHGPITSETFEPHLEMIQILF